VNLATGGGYTVIILLTVSALLHPLSDVSLKLTEYRPVSVKQYIGAPPLIVSPLPKVQFRIAWELLAVISINWIHNGLHPLVVLAEKDITGVGFTVIGIITVCILELHPSVSSTVIVLSLVGVKVTVRVVWLLGNHRKVYIPSPPDALAVSVMVVPGHTDAFPDIVRLRAALTCIGTVAIAVHPLASVTVIV
jgi:hypothetical protein